MSEPCVRAVRHPPEQRAYSVFEEYVPPDPCRNFVDAMASLQIGKDERFCTPHHPRITIHHIQVGAHIRRQIRFVDHQQGGTRESRATFVWHFILEDSSIKFEAIVEMQK